MRRRRSSVRASCFRSDRAASRARGENKRNHAELNKDQDWTKGNAALRANMETGNPVRVMRCLPPAYTSAEVAEHASDGDCWIVIRGADGGDTEGDVATEEAGKERAWVYDVTEWMNGGHPGGFQAIRDLCGGDATEAFNDQMAHAQALPKGERFRVGRVVDPDDDKAEDGFEVGGDVAPPVAAITAGCAMPNETKSPMAPKITIALPRCQKGRR